MIVLGIVVFLLPPISTLVHRRTGKSIPWWGRLLIIAALMGTFNLAGMLHPATSIYKSAETEAGLMSLYDARLAEWPVPHESIYLDTSYGRVHVIASGPEGAPPVLLIHASAVAAWSWIFNIEALSRGYRTYAVDTIGDAGKSVLTDVGRYLAGGSRGGLEISDFYTEISGKLGFERSHIIGASVGGYIATNYAL